MFPPNLSPPQGPVVCVLPYFSKKAGKYRASRKGNGVSLESFSVTRSGNLRKESLFHCWKLACPKWLLFLSLGTAPSFLSVNICWGTWCCRSTIAWHLRDLDSFLYQFRVCLVFGQLPKVSLLLFPSAQSGLCIQDFPSVILHLSYLCFDHLLADAVFLLCVRM